MQNVIDCITSFLIIVDYVTESQSCRDDDPKLNANAFHQLPRNRENLIKTPSPKHTERPKC